MHGVPRIAAVEAKRETELFVRFENGVEKTYDCREILARPEFHLLRAPAFFRAVKLDPGGYGVSWSDSLDLSGDELWFRGRPVSSPVGEQPADGGPR